MTPIIRRRKHYAVNAVVRHVREELLFANPVVSRARDRHQLPANTSEFFDARNDFGEKIHVQSRDNHPNQGTAAGPTSPIGDRDSGLAKFIRPDMNPLPRVTRHATPIIQRT